METNQEQTYTIYNSLKEMTPNELARFILIVVATIALGFVILNGFIKFQYYNRIMSNPCDVCLEDNPELMLNKKIPEFNEDKIISQEDLLYNLTFDLRVPG